MAIVFKNNKYNFTIDSNTIIGVMGEYDKLFKSLIGDDIYYIDKVVKVSSKKVNCLLDNSDNKVLKLIKEFNLDEEFLSKKICDLSHSEEKLLKYILMVLSNKKIIIIDEPYLDLDYDNKKKIIVLLKDLIKKGKTIIIGSNDSNIIYPLCKKVLFINNDEYYYDNIDVFKDEKILKKYHIETPDLVTFTKLAKDKNIRLSYSKDIRDLIKDVYRNVSKK